MIPSLAVVYAKIASKGRKGEEVGLQVFFFGWETQTLIRLLRAEFELKRWNRFNEFGEARKEQTVFGIFSACVRSGRGEKRKSNYDGSCRFSTEKVS